MTKPPKKPRGRGSRGTAVENVASYDADVKEAKEILTRTDKDTWRLAEIIAGLEPSYGKGTLAKFGRDVGLAASTVRLYRQVFDRFGKLENARALAFWACARLVSLPEGEAEAIIKERPNLSDRDAVAIIDERKDEAKVEKQENKELAAKEHPNAQEMWQSDLERAAKTMIATPSVWTRNLGNTWREFAVTDELVKLAKQAADTWTTLATYLEEKLKSQKVLQQRSAKEEPADKTKELVTTTPGEANDTKRRRRPNHRSR